jgi:hypothetical protein
VENRRNIFGVGDALRRILAVVIGGNQTRGQRKSAEKQKVSGHRGSLGFVSR